MSAVARLGVGIELVGRAGELAALTAALDRAAAGVPTGLLLSGDAGVGKSRLVGETVARATAAGFTALTGSCLDTADAALPYLPFTEIVGTLVAAHPELLERYEALRLLLPDGSTAHADATGEDRALGQIRVFDAVLSALAELSTRGPVLLVVEDLHWADRSSRDLLFFLASRLSGQRLVVLVTYRRDDLHRRHPLRKLLAELVRLPAVERIELEPLGAADTLELVRLLADGAFDPPMLDRVARRSEGNAFFAEELVRACSDGIPHELAEVLMARVETLSAPAQAMLRVAAVAGRRVRHDRLVAVAGMGEDELESALREAVTHHVLLADRPSGDGYLFRHALLREAIYHDLLPGERTRLHARYARLLADSGAPGTAAELAHHAFAGHDLPRALRASIEASTEADARYAPAEMLLHAERALELWSAVPDAVAVAGVDEATVTRWASWGRSLTGDPERGATLALRALELARSGADPAHTTHLARRYAQLLLELPGREADALAAGLQALELAADGPPAELAWARAVLGRVHWRIDRPDLAEVHARAAIAVAEQVPDDRVATGAKADALITLSTTESRAGRPEQGRELLAQAGLLARRSGHLVVELRTEFNTGMSLLEDGRLAEAATAFAAGQERAGQTGITWSGYGIDLRVAYVVATFMSGEWDRATAAAAIADERLSASVATRLIVAELLVATARGRFAAVQKRVEELRANPVPDEQVIVLAGQVGVEAALWAGNPAEAVLRAEEALDALAALVTVAMGAISVAALAIAGVADLATAGALTPDEAATTATKLLAVAEHAAAHGMPRSTRLGPEGRAWLARARAELTRITGPDPAAWSVVVDEFSYERTARFTTGYRQAYALLRRAEANRTTGSNHPAVAADLRRAAAAARELGAAPLGAAVQALADRAGVRLDAPADRPPTASTALTPRERSVLTLVAEGHTNRRIGAELFISEKTVSVHLSRVMAKLGVSSRTEAVSVAYTRGLLSARP